MKYTTFKKNAELQFTFFVIYVFRLIAPIVEIVLRVNFFSGQYFT